tara:strand:- start:129 stop:827 length:699 start_codon:yes stop_codon:yes gene_type:complete
VTEAIIVGSGRSLLGSGLGEKIDSFEHVIRFNGSDLYLEKYKEDVGTKTTVFVLNSNRRTIRGVYKKIKHGGLLTNKQIKSVIITATIGNPRAWIRRSLAGKRLINHLKKNKDIGWRMLTHGQARRTLKDYSLDTKARWSVKRRRRVHKNRYWGFTSGFIVLCNAIKKYDKVYLCGFDWLAKDGAWRKPKDGRRGHFYNNRKLPMHRHRLSWESKLIKQLIIKSKKIEILDP